MPLRLTTATIAALPTNHRRDYYDEALAGLCVRVTTSGHKSWCVTYKHMRRTRRYTLGPVDRLTPSEARAEARKVLARASLGQDPQGEKAAARRQAAEPRPEALSVADLVRRALESIELRPSTRREWARIATTEIYPAPLGRRPATALTSKELRRWSLEVAGRRRYAANIALTIVRRAYTWGLERDLVAATPCAGVRPPTKEPVSDRVLSPAECWALMSGLRIMGRAADRAREVSSEGAAAHVTAAWLLLLTAVRRGEVVGARREEFSDLDGPRAQWVVPAARCKGKRVHVVPLSPAAARVVRARLARVSGSLLFPQQRQDPKAEPRPMHWSGEFVAALKRLMRQRLGCEVPRWKVHNFRHTFATTSRELFDTAEDVVTLVLGQSLRGTPITRHYDRSELLAQRRIALERWAEWLGGIGRPRGA